MIPMDINVLTRIVKFGNVKLGFKVFTSSISPWNTRLFTSTAPSLESQKYACPTCSGKWLSVRLGPISSVASEPVAMDLTNRNRMAEGFPRTSSNCASSPVNVMMSGIAEPTAYESWT